jgi:hypothetical protein
MRGNTEQARSSYARYVELAGTGDHDRLLYDALVDHTAGNEQESKRATEEFESRFGASDPLSCAVIRAGRGEADAAFAWLHKALAARDPALAEVKTEVYLRSLRSDPRWNALLEKIGLPPD